MLHVFIDTNVLLRFYAYSDDNLSEVEKLSALLQAGQINLLVTEQIVDERARNRDKELNESIKRLEQPALTAQIPRFAEHHASAKKFQIAMGEAKAARSELMAEIKAEIGEGSLRADRVIQQMFDSSKVLSRTSEIIQKASLRRELGNPPGKRESLGDQINWEIMLECVPEGTDLHIISRDGDFGGGPAGSAVNFFLRGEWNFKKKAKLHLYSGLSEFAKAHFPHIKVPSDAVKAACIKKLASSASFSTTHSAISELMPMMDSLDNSDLLQLLSALTENTQISSIIDDPDVKGFYSEVYNKAFFTVPPELDSKLEVISKDIFAVPF